MISEVPKGCIHTTLLNNSQYIAENAALKIELDVDAELKCTKNYFVEKVKGLTFAQESDRSLTNPGPCGHYLLQRKSSSFRTSG